VVGHSAWNVVGRVRSAMAFADVNGQHLYYEDSGGDGPPVVMSHGFLMDHEMFAPQVEALAGRLRIITLDARGHGQTAAGGSFDYWDLAKDVLALMDHLDIAAATLAGMSQGGFVSLRAAILASERVRALVLIDSQAGLENEESVPAYEAMHEEWLANGPAAVQEVVAAIILGGDCDPTPWYAKWAALPRESFTAPFRCLMDRDDLTPRLGEITQPAIIFHGDQDAAIPMERAEILCAGLSGCGGIVVVEGGGHAANLSHPDQVNDPLAEFVEQYG
jgi:pimeloyl-ACP methyl ester carboxylesterase